MTHFNRTKQHQKISELEPRTATASKWFMRKVSKKDKNRPYKVIRSHIPLHLGQILQYTDGAMAANGQHWLDKLQKFREGELKDEQGAKDKLEEIHKFLTDHEAVSPTDCTHEVLNGFGDWWVSQKSTKRLGIAEDNTVDAFYKHMATMYEMGVPLTLGEKRTPEFKLLQHIEIRGTKDDYVKPAELMGVESKFLRILGKHMKELFPSPPDLHVIIFDGSGTSSLLGVLQTTVRFVWPQIIVDKKRAGEIMQYLAQKLSSSEDEDITTLQSRMLELWDHNNWENIFADSIYFGSVAIRMAAGAPGFQTVKHLLISE